MKSTLFEGLLPPSAVIVEAEPGMWESGLLPDELPYVQRCVDKRRREFTAGRNCARRALQQLGLDASAILVGSGRAPQFPAGVSGSITHTVNYCAAAAICSDGSLSLGIDAESDRSRDDETWPLVVSASERTQIAVLNCQKAHCWERLFFSAKEAFYKATFPRHLQFIDFRDVVVEVQPQDEVFALRIITPAISALVGRQTFIGRYRFEAGLVLTAIVIG